MVEYTKRPGFPRETATATPIDGAEYDADGNLLLRVVQNFPANPSNVEGQFMARQLEMIELLRDIRAELSRMNFVMATYSGVETEREDFRDHDGE